MLKPLLSLGLALLLPWGWVHAQEPWQLDDLYLAKWVDSPAISPDGRFVAYVEYETLLEDEHSEYRGHIFLTGVDGGGNRQLTRGGTSCLSPAWSPDQRWLAFLSARETGHVNLWVMDPTGGEARRLTEADGDISAFRWSPIGHRIAFTMFDPPSAEEVRAKKEKEDVLVVDRNAHPIRLYRVDFPAEGQLPVKPVRLSSGESSVNGFDWAPDGKHLAISHQPTSRIGDWRNSDLALISAEDGAMTALVADAGMDMGPKFSPDGKRIAFVSDRGNRSWARDWRICWISSQGGPVQVLPKTHDEMPGLGIDAGLLGWDPEGRGILYTEFEGTDIQLYLIPADGSAYRRITSLPGQKWSFGLSSRRGLVAFESDSFAQAPELYLQPIDGAAQRLTRENARLPERRFSKSEVIQWKSFDGMTVEGILTYPLDYREGLRYPLIVELHGGPTFAFSKSFPSGPFELAQPLAAEGFASLKVNPRGSSGYGQPFRFANLRDWGGKDVRDVLAGVDHLVATGLADPERLGVFGWSYGGFLTAMTISRDQRFKAAMVGAGPTDLISFAGTTDIPGFVPSFLEAEHWQEPARWMDGSAVFHVAEITTPTLLLYWQEDARVPPSQGYELYRALQRKGVETQLVVYPRATHFHLEPKHALDGDQRILAWFHQHLGPRE